MYTETILDIDFRATVGSPNYWISPSVQQLQANGSGAQNMRLNIPVGDCREVVGMVHCDKGCTVNLLWGFSHNTSAIGMAANNNIAIPGSPQTPFYDLTETGIVSSPDSGFATGGGTVIGPVVIKSPLLNVTVLNTGVATANFRLFLMKRMY